MTEKKKKAPPLRRILGVAAFLLACMAMGACLGMYVDAASASDDMDMGLILLGLAMLYLAIPLQIILHEGGHLVFGLMTGYRFVSFNVFGFIWSRRADGRIRLGRSRIAGAAGQCLLAPPPWDEGRFPVTLYNMGGVIANGAVAAVCAGLAIPAYRVPWLFLFLAAMALVGVLLALTNGLPLTTAAIQNDGKNQRCIQRSMNARRALWLQLSIAAEVAQGRTLRSLPEDWFAPFPEETMRDPLVSAIGVFRCNRLMESGDLPATLEAIRALLDGSAVLLPLYRMLLHCDGAVCELLTGQPGDCLAALSAREEQAMMKAMSANPAILRTRYAIALLHEKDASAAQRHLAAFGKAAKKHPYPQEAAGERLLIARIDDAAKEALP